MCNKYRGRLKFSFTELYIVTENAIDGNLVSYMSNVDYSEANKRKTVLLPVPDFPVLF